MLAGTAGALALGGLVTSLRFEVHAHDPRIVGTVAGLMLTIGVTASVLAARRSLAIDPAAALREQ